MRSPARPAHTTHTLFTGDFQILTEARSAPQAGVLGPVLRPQDARLPVLAQSCRPAGSPSPPTARPEVPTHLCREGTVVHCVLRALRVRGSPVEVELLQPVVALQGPPADPCKRQQDVHPSAPPEFVFWLDFPPQGQAQCPGHPVLWCKWVQVPILPLHGDISQADSELPCRLFRCTAQSLPICAPKSLPRPAGRWARAPLGTPFECPWTLTTKAVAPYPRPRGGFPGGPGAGASSPRAQLATSCGGAWLRCVSRAASLRRWPCAQTWPRLSHCEGLTEH